VVALVRADWLLMDMLERQDELYHRRLILEQDHCLFRPDRLTSALQIGERGGSRRIRRVLTPPRVETALLLLEHLERSLKAQLELVQASRSARWAPEPAARRERSKVAAELAAAGQGTPEELRRQVQQVAWIRTLMMERRNALRARDHSLAGSVSILPLQLRTAADLVLRSFQSTRVEASSGRCPRLCPANPSNVSLRRSDEAIAATP
jgi:hypothetical protein